ncbi:MAG: hypothetical protein AAF404_02120 [Pseudomonadota bacterium]
MAWKYIAKRTLHPMVTVLVLFFTGISAAAADHLKPRHQREHNHRSQALLSSYLGVGLGFGGDEVGRFTDNQGYTDSIHSGGGFLFEGGLNLSVDPYTNLRLSAGYQLDGTSRGNGSSVFDRLRFDLALLKSYGQHEFGAGVTAHTSVGYRCDITSICQGDVEFNHAVGYTLEYAIRFAGIGWNDAGRGVRLGARYTGIEYTPRLQDAEILNGNSVTGFIGVTF